MKQIFLALFFGLLFGACKSSNEEKLNHFMVNSWQTSYIKIKMPTANGKDSTKVYEDDFSKKGAILAQSKYNKDKTFTAWYVKADGTKMGETSGSWYVKKDSLFVEYIFKGKTIKPSYFITKTTNGFEAKSVYDWDGDGEKDDILLIKSKKIE